MGLGVGLGVGLVVLKTAHLVVEPLEGPAVF